MPETSKEILRPLNEFGDMLRIRFVREGKAVIRFAVQYEANIDGVLRRVVRFDMAHGFAHRDDIDWNGNTIAKVPMPGHLDYNDALTLAINDLATNWYRYRAAFLERQP